MNPTTLVSFLPAQFRPLALAVLGLAGTLYVVLHALDALVQGALTVWPSAQWLKTADQWLHAAISWWPHRLQPAPEAPKSGSPASTPPRGFAVPWLVGFLLALPVLLVGFALSCLIERAYNRGSARVGVAILAGLGVAILAGLTLSATGCASVSWAHPVLFAGPSVALVEVSPSRPTPQRIAAGAGEQMTLGLGQFTLAGRTWDALDLSGVALGSLSGSGSIQAGAIAGTLNDIIGLGALVTPYAADGSGFVQGGRPGVTWAALVNVQALVAEISPATPPSGRMRYEAAPPPRGGLTW